MGTTTRWGAPFPELIDGPDGPAQIRNLAVWADGVVGRAFPCLATARPTLAAADDGFLIRETDTGAVRMWDGANWSQDMRPSSAGGGTGDGGGTTEAPGTWVQYSASSAQNIPSERNTECAFGVADSTDAAVKRQAYGDGHLFKLQASGIWTVSATVRYADSASVGERYTGIHWAADTASESEGDPLAGQGPGEGASGAVTNNVSVTRWFDVGDAVFVSLWQGTGGSRKLEPGEGGATGKGWVRINLALVAT